MYIYIFMHAHKHIYVNTHKYSCLSLGTHVTLPARQPSPNADPGICMPGAMSSNKPVIYESPVLWSVSNIQETNTADSVTVKNFKFDCMGTTDLWHSGLSILLGTNSKRSHTCMQAQLQLLCSGNINLKAFFFFFFAMRICQTQKLLDNCV